MSCQSFFLYCSLYRTETLYGTQEERLQSPLSDLILTAFGLFVPGQEQSIKGHGLPLFVALVSKDSVKGKPIN